MQNNYTYPPMNQQQLQQPFCYTLPEPTTSYPAPPVLNPPAQPASVSVPPRRKVFGIRLSNLPVGLTAQQLCNFYRALDCEVLQSQVYGSEGRVEFVDEAALRLALSMERIVCVYLLMPQR
ncbi:hypothetical protein Pelo_19717 [Pelomyxa schiedti]|nr:hypothetical protein Pelo_19717 [Pelomyxa schiedti]